MRPRPAIIALALASAIAAPGCSEGPVRAPDVDAPRAREALRTALEGWKNGRTPAALKAGSPAIVVQDLDWEAGAALAAFEVRGEGKADTANLRIPVELTLRDAKGKEARKAVTYVVGTSPTITVFREIF